MTRNVDLESARRAIAVLAGRSDGRAGHLRKETLHGTAHSRIPAHDLAKRTAETSDEDGIVAPLDLGDGSELSEQLDRIGDALFWTGGMPRLRRGDAASDLLQHVGHGLGTKPVSEDLEEARQERHVRLREAPLGLGRQLVQVRGLAKAAPQTLAADEPVALEASELNSNRVRRHANGAGELVHGRGPLP